jgi:type I restriction enzyme S subunit
MNGTETGSATLAELCDLISEQVHPADVPEALYVGLEHVTPRRLRRSGGGIAADVQSHKYAFRRNDILYGKLRPYLDKAILADTDGVCTTELLVLRAKPGVDPRFLACLVHDPDFVEHALTGVTGAHHPRTSWAHIAQFERPRFSLEEQRTIAGLLWRTQDLLRACEDTIETAQKLKQVAMRELFTRGLRGEPQKETEIGPVPESWLVQRLDTIAQVVTTRMAYSELETAEVAKENGVHVIGIKVSDMNREGNETVLTSAALEKTLDAKVAEYRCAPPGTIVFPKRGAAIATNKKRLTKRWSVFDPNVIGVVPGASVNAGFLFHWFQSFDLRTITEPGPTPQLNKKHLDPLLIPVPTDIEEQRDIVAILDAIDRKIDLHGKKRGVLEKLFKALLHKLMTGEIRVEELDLSALDRVEPEAEEAVA